MQSSVIITIVGPDRPGLVEIISRVVETASGNWTHSRMAHLGGQFAGMLQIETDDSHIDGLVAALKDVEAGGGLTVTVVSETGGGNFSPSDGATAVLDLLGQDRPGIVRQIAAAIAARGANIEDLSTECFSAPMSGETMFRATASLHLPAGVSISDIQQDLEAIALDLMVDLSIDPATS